MSDLKVNQIYEVYLTGKNLDKNSEDFDGDKYVVQFSRYICLSYAKIIMGPIQDTWKWNARILTGMKMIWIKLEEMLENSAGYEKKVWNDTQQVNELVNK